MSIIPEQTDPRWRELVMGSNNFQLESLAVRMLITRLRLRTRRGDEAAIEEAVGVAYAFFSRNLHAAQADLVAIFGVME